LQKKRALTSLTARDIQEVKNNLKRSKYYSLFIFSYSSFFPNFFFDVEKEMQKSEVSHIISYDSDKESNEDKLKKISEKAKNLMMKNDNLRKMPMLDDN